MLDALHMRAPAPGPSFTAVREAPRLVASPRSAPLEGVPARPLRNPARSSVHEPATGPGSDQLVKDQLVKNAKRLDLGAPSNTPWGLLPPPSELSARPKTSEAPKECPANLEHPLSGGVVARYAPNDGIVEIHLHVHLRHIGFVGEYAGREQEAQRAVDEALRHLASMFASDGFSLRVTATHDTTGAHYPAPPPQGAALVYLYPEDSSMNVNRWGANAKWTTERRAKIFAHELLHLFGIGDEYPRPGVPPEVAATFEDDSLMKNWDHPQARLYPRHVRQVISPWRERCAAPLAPKQ